MPNIRQYDNPINGIRPSETGAEAWNRAGMRIEENYGKAANARRQGAAEEGQALGVIGRTVDDVGRIGGDVAAQVQQRQTQHEVSQSLAKSSAFLADSAAQWDGIQKTTNENDMGTAQQGFLKDVTDKLNKQDADFSTPAGQEYWARQKAQIQDHFLQSTHADVVTAAAQATKTNLADMQNNLAHAVNSSPATLDASLAMIDHGVDSIVAQHKNLSGRDAVDIANGLKEDMRRTTAAVGIKAAMDRNPEAGKAMLADPKYASLLKAQDIESLDSHYKETVRAQRQDSLVADANRERQAREASEARAGQYISSLVVKDANGMPTNEVKIPDGFNASVLADPALKPSERFALVSGAHEVLARQNATAPVRNDPGVAADLMNRLGDDTNPTKPQEITDAVRDGKLTPQFGMDLIGKSFDGPSKQMQAITKDPIVQSEFAKATSRLTSVDTNGFKILGGNQNFAGKQAADQFKMDTLRTLQDAKVHGQDIAPFLDPKSPSYLFSPERIGQYMPSVDEMKKGLLMSRPMAGITPASFTRAITDQEGPGTSSQGAVTGIMPDTFKQYAKPGEDINNAQDRDAVKQRIISDLWSKTGGDPARMAVGWFSGPGNVSPQGSANPWIADKADANGKSVSSYVADIKNRLNMRPDLGDIIRGALTFPVKSASNK